MNEIERNLINTLQSQTLKHNVVAQLAKAEDRDYITPEDVHAAFEAGHPEDKVRLDVLEVLANTSGFGVEDYKLTAWVAFEGKEK